MIGWISDLFLLGWGTLSWNTRKTWHILRGRRHRCPCQVASDSGRAYETGCEAVTHLHSPGRFRAVCPLLQRRADGAWVCSVDTARVRPFWGRALLLLAGGGLAAYLAVTLLAFALLSAMGYRVSYRQTVWPPAWRELRVAQAQRYLEEARAAREEGRAAEALLALSNAYELNPADYGSGFLLAQLWQAGQPVLADNVFSQLYRDHPEHREQTAQAWYRGLLARGHFTAIPPLARDRLLDSGDTPPSPAWIQAFVFSVRRVERFAIDEELLNAPRLSPSHRALLRLEKTLPALDTARRVELLVEALAHERDPFACTHLLRRLLEEKRPDLVLARLASSDLPLGDREKVRLRLDALADLGRDAERAALVRRVLALPVNPAIWELLSSHLIAHPDRTLLHLVAEHHRRAPLPPEDSNYPQLLAWFAACGVHADAELLSEAGSFLAQVVERDSPSIDHARQAFLGPRSAFRLESVLPLIQPLPLEPAYALHDHYAPPPPPPN